MAVGNFPAAIEAIDAVLAINSGNVEAIVDKADVLRQTGHYAHAIESCTQALALNPSSAHGYVVRAASRWSLNLRESALADIRRAVVLGPRPEVKGLLGIYLQGCGRSEEGLPHLLNAVKGDAKNPFWHKHLADCYHLRGDYQSAFREYQEAVTLDDRYVDAYCDLSGLLSSTFSYPLAESVARLAILLKPTSPNAYRNLGVALQMQKKEEDAIEAYATALTLNPDFHNALVNMRILRDRNCDWTDRDADWTKLRDHTYRKGQQIPPFGLIAVLDEPSEHLLCARVSAAVAKSTVPSETSGSPEPSRRASEKIRIGYMSADYNDHATANLITEHFERHDRNRFDVFAYSIGINDGSTMRRRIERSVDTFVDLGSMEYEAAANRIRADAIDILVDLKGYTLHSKPQILAHRPAPIQINYLGYPGTMGADFIDYIIADPIVLPMDQQPHYDEKIVHLPDCYQPNDRLRPLPEPVTSRADCGLPDEAFVFCCFNYAYKISPDMFAIWMRILAAVPHSVLWLLDSGEQVSRNLRKEAARHGIEEKRLVFAKKAPLKDHLCRVAAADLLLDTLPYNAHTTASDALWVGLPVLTCSGRSFASRVAASLLHAAGLPELVMDSLALYEAEAIRLANDPAVVAALRARLMTNRSTSALFDTTAYTRHFETALTTMVAQRERGEPPRPFSVERT